MSENGQDSLGTPTPYSRRCDVKGACSFLDSPVLGLRCSSSPQIFNMHEAILQSKGGIIYASFLGKFKEKAEGTYKLKETTEGTLLRYIEWAYRGNYPDVLNS
ncbi:hypothetical protein ACJ73_06827 [Blastomyces percursus]|uniref:BTB domain-containing protein n=1 Tax=Blastomyces percursus TaxID=1658174 RepID=A0A1J9PZU2_9EURO|nr:hypothetical protein ACJ73_06827 [Blastomyces percursus]